MGARSSGACAPRDEFRTSPGVPRTSTDAYKDRRMNLGDCGQEIRQGGLESVLLDMRCTWAGYFPRWEATRLCVLLSNWLAQQRQLVLR